MAVQESIRIRSIAGDPTRSWLRGLPELRDGALLLRELELRDAPSLLAHLNNPRVLQHVAPCPSTERGFRRFIRWTHLERRRGLHACYGIIPPGEAAPVGIVQVWWVERDFSTAEWGFILGDSFWGTGVFMRSAHLFLDAVFETLNVLRLESRPVVENGRGNAVFRKLGATSEGVLRSSFRHGGVVRDQVMWSILASEWAAHRDRAHGIG